MEEIFAVTRVNIQTPRTHLLHNLGEWKYPQSEINKDEVELFISQLYPNGISRHGTQYLETNYATPQGSDGNVYFPVSPILETIYELVRLWKFPNLPSRFICGFACRTIKEAEKFRDECCGGKGEIIKISGKIVFEGDMSLLKTGNTILDMVTNSIKYWSGEKSTSPQLELLIEVPYNVIEVLK